MEAVRSPQRLGREEGSRSSGGMNYRSAIRTPAQMPATPPRPLKRSDCTENEPAPHISGMNPPSTMPKVAHMPMTDRPMPN
jgi:hypothetical protein